MAGETAVRSTVDDTYWHDAAPTTAPDLTSQPTASPELVSRSWRTQTIETVETVVETRRLRHPRRTMVGLPTPLQIRFGKDYVAVVEPITGMHGLGATTGAAIADFWEALADFDSALEDPLAPNMRGLRKALDLFMAL